MRREKINSRKDVQGTENKTSPVIKSKKRVKDKERKRKREGGNERGEREKA